MHYGVWSVKQENEGNRVSSELCTRKLNYLNLDK